MVSAILINNFKAHQALSDLRKLPLPPVARVVDERGVVGRFLGDTGNYTDIVAYRVFVTDLSEGEIERFYIERPELFLMARNVDTPFQELSKLGEKRCVVPIELAVAKVPDNERGKRAFWHPHTAQVKQSWTFAGTDFGFSRAGGLLE